jgi:hypothetical protein
MLGVSCLMAITSGGFARTPARRQLKISTASAELLFARMHTKIDRLRAELDRLKKSDPVKKLGALGGRNW